VNVVYLVILGIALVGIECFIGGTRLIFSLPAYGVISIGALLTVASMWRKRIPPNALCVFSTLALGGWVVYRAMHSPIEYLALPDLFMMMACLMMYLITAYYLTGTGVQTGMIAILWAIAAAEIWVGMVQFGKDPNFMLFGLIRPAYQRASGMYISPNNFAGYLVAVAIVSISMGVWSRWKGWAKFLAFYIAMCCLLGVAISGSRGGYFDAIGSLLAFAIGSIYTVRVADPRRFMAMTLVTLTAVGVVVVVAAFLMSHSDYLTYRMHTMVSKDVRIYNWEAAIDHIKVSPWTGTGSGTHLIYGRLFRRPEIQVDPVHAHCDYLELLAEYGIIGGICMAIFVFAHVWNGLGTFSVILRRRLVPSGLHRSNRFAMQLGALCAVGGLAIHSVVDFDMHIPANALVFAFLFGVLANPGIERPLGLADRVTPWLKIMAPALGVVMLWRGMPLIPSEYCSELARRALRSGDFMTSILYAKKGLGMTQGNAGAATDAPPTLVGVDPKAKPELLDTVLTKTGGNPKNPDLYFYLGEANRVTGVHMINPYMQKRYFREASAAFTAGLSVFPQDESMLIRDGQTLDGLHHWVAAEAIYQQALNVDPKLDKIHEYYAVHLEAEGKKAEAAAARKAWEEHRVMPVGDDEKVDSPIQQ